MITKEAVVDEKTVRKIFDKYYKVGDLNDRLVETEDEIRITIIRGAGEPSETLPAIVETITRAQSRIDFFKSFVGSGASQLKISMHQMGYLNIIRKTMLEAMNYMNDNYDTVHQWFRDRVPRADLPGLIKDVSGVIFGPSELTAGTRTITPNEIRLEEIFFGMALNGILGEERFQKYADEYNDSIIFLRQCQAEAMMLTNMKDIKNMKKN